MPGIRFTAPWALPLAALAAVAVAGCSAPPEPLTQAEIEQRVAASAALADRFGKELQAELRAAMAAGGTRGGITVCSERAPDIARRLSEESGAIVRRTAFRTRNPLAAPAADERMLMEPWRDAPFGADGQPQQGYRITPVAGRGAEFLYMRAIPLAAECQTCHGPAEILSEETREALVELYPEDQATGFATGDFRGAFSIRWPAGAAPPAR